MRINKRVAVLAVLFFALLCVCVCALSAQAASCNLAVSWNPNTEPDIAGYRVYVTYTYAGKECFKRLADVGNKTSYQGPVVLPGNTRAGKILITAYDLAGNESAPSDPVSFKIPARGAK